MIDTKITLDNVVGIASFLSDMPGHAGKAINGTISDLKQRIPSCVSKCVRRVYNIKAKELKPQSLLRRGGAGNLHITGTSHLSTLRFTYTGRLLTPVHFDMKPKLAPKPIRGYILTAKVFKNKGAVKFGQHLGFYTPGGPYSRKSGNILMGTGAKSASKVQQIPMQRVSKRRLDLEKFTTLSMPQMVSSEYTRDDIQKEVSELARKRMDHYADRELLGAG